MSVNASERARNRFEPIKSENLSDRYSIRVIPCATLF